MSLLWCTRELFRIREAFFVPGGCGSCWTDFRPNCVLAQFRQFDRRCSQMRWSSTCVIRFQCEAQRKARYHTAFRRRIVRSVLRRPYVCVCMCMYMYVGIWLFTLDDLSLPKVQAGFFFFFFFVPFFPELGICTPYLRKRLCDSEWSKTEGKKRLHEVKGMGIVRVWDWCEF